MGARFSLKIAYVQKFAKSAFSEKCHFRGLLRTFLATLLWGFLFSLVLFWLVARMSKRWTRAKRYETRGFGPISRLSSSSTPPVALKASILRTVLDDNFFCVSLFSTFRSSIFWRNSVLRFKNALGLQSRGRFQKRLFCVVSGARANLTRGGRAGASAFLSGLVSLAKMALPLRCGGFSRLFRSLFDPFFANFNWSSSQPPLSA